MKLSKRQARKFGWKGISGWAFAADKFPSISCALINVSGRHGLLKNIGSDRLYFVISGSGKFKVKGKAIKVKAPDIVLIPKNTPYDYEGKMKLFLADSPAFNPKDDVRLD